MDSHPCLLRKSGASRPKWRISSVCAPHLADHLPGRFSHKEDRKKENSWFRTNPTLLVTFFLFKGWASEEGLGHIEEPC